MTNGASGGADTGVRSTRRNHPPGRDGARIRAGRGPGGGGGGGPGRGGGGGGLGWASSSSRVNIASARGMRRGRSRGCRRFRRPRRACGAVARDESTGGRAVNRCSGAPSQARRAMGAPGSAGDRSRGRAHATAPQYPRGSGSSNLAPVATSLVRARSGASRAAASSRAIGPRSASERAFAAPALQGGRASLAHGQATPGHGVPRVDEGCRGASDSDSRGHPAAHQTEVPFAAATARDRPVMLARVYRRSTARRRCSRDAGHDELRAGSASGRVHHDDIETAADSRVRLAGRRPDVNARRRPTALFAQSYCRRGSG